MARENWTQIWEYEKPVKKQKDFMLEQPTLFYRVVKRGEASFEIQSKMEHSRVWDRAIQVGSLGAAQQYIESIE